MQAPYPSDTRAKGWRFELDVERVIESDAWALAKSGQVRGFLILLFAASWAQEPCGSLPDDDDAIGAMIGMRKKAFAAARCALLNGWQKASDGRLYHPMLVEQVAEMLANRARGWRKHRDDVLSRDGYRCSYCGSTVELTLDHVLPRSRGGVDSVENLVAACRPCNSSKGAKTPEEWRSH